MYPIRPTILPPPEALKNDVECVRVATYGGGEEVELQVSPTGVPGLVFHQSHGRSALEQIVTRSGRSFSPPPLFLYGPIVEPSVMTYKKAAFTTIQVIFKPYALKTLFGINASTLAPGWTDLDEFWKEDLTSQLMEARNEQEQLALLTSFLVSKLRQEEARDPLVEESLHLIHANIGALHVRDLLTTLHISERQFERRFTQAVGLPPQVYLRVKRFNEAIRLIKTGRFTRLTDVAAALNFSDQSHFIRDLRTFSGMTPTSLAQKVDDFYHAQAGFSFA